MSTDNIPIANEPFEGTSAPSTSAPEINDVDYLLRVPFHRHSMQDKLLVKKVGRPTPKLNIIQYDGVTRKTKRSFSTEHYKKTKWLTASKTQNRFFCWPCLLFNNAGSKDVWHRQGFDDLKNLPRSVERHEASKPHVTASLKLKLFGKVRINEAICQAEQIAVKKHNEIVRKNRDIMRRMVDGILYLGKQELALRGHDESENSSSKGNFLELMQLLGEYDTLLFEHLKTATVFRGLSKSIQNDIIESIDQVLCRKIDEEIFKSSFLAVQVDDTTDVSCRSQLSIIVRYVNEKGAICERFLGFYDVSLHRDALTLCTLLLEVLKKYTENSKLVCQTYDGASCMSGELSGLQARIKEIYPQAYFIHCCAHRLNLVLAQGSSHIQEARLFFASLSAFSTFFSRSPKRTALLDEEATAMSQRQPSRIPRGCATRWNFKSKVVEAVFEGRAVLLSVLNRMTTEPGWDKETIALATGLVTSLNDFTFMFLLVVFRGLFIHTSILFQTLQKKTLDLTKATQKIKTTMQTLQNIRNDEKFEEYFEEASSFVDVSDAENSTRNRRRRRWADYEEGLNNGDDEPQPSFKDRFRRMFFELVDSIKEQMKIRFEDLSKMNFFTLVEKANFASYAKPGNFPLNKVKLLQEAYPFFNEVKLKNGLQAIYEDETFHKTPQDLLLFISEEDLADELPEVIKLLQLMLTIPVTSVSAERSFSCLKRLKTYLRNTMGQTRLSSLARISMENEFIQQLKAEGNFYEEIIDAFAAMKDRRAEFHFK